MVTAVRLLLAVVVLGLLVVVVLVIHLAGNAEQVVRNVVETEGSQTLGAAVTVREIDLELRGTRGTLRGIDIGNPPGFHVHGRRAIAIDSVEVELDAARSDAGTLVLRRVVARGIAVFAVVRAPDDTNVHGLLRGLDDAQRRRAETGAAEDRNDRRYVLEEVELLDIALDAMAELSRRRMAAELPDMRLVDPGDGPAGTGIEGLLRAVIAPLAAAVGDAAAQQGLDGSRPLHYFEAAR
jgi:hypothetical protein